MSDERNDSGTVDVKPNTDDSKSCDAAKGCEHTPVVVVLFLAGTIWETRYALCEEHRALLAEKLVVKPSATEADPLDEAVQPGDRMSEKDAKERGLLCIAWGPFSAGCSTHHDCPVVVREVSQVIPDRKDKLGKLPALCECDCTVCKRAWWDMDQPMRNGDKIVTRSGRTIA